MIDLVKLLVPSPVLALRGTVHRLHECHSLAPKSRAPLSSRCFTRSGQALGRSRVLYPSSSARPDRQKAARRTQGPIQVKLRKAPARHDLPSSSGPDGGAPSAANNAHDAKIPIERYGEHEDEHNPMVTPVKLRA